MSAYERTQKSTLINRLKEKPERLTVVTGPRQTGKTTLVGQVLQQIAQKHRYLSVDEPDTLTLPSAVSPHGSFIGYQEQSAVPFANERNARWLARHWEQARLDARDFAQGFVLAIDEVQKIPNWSETIKGLWDADRRQGCLLHVILLGSAPLLMQQGMAESLAGRYETIHLTHWSFAEMSAAFDFDLPRYIYFGGYPGAASLIGDHDRWSSYIAEALIEPNIERDILAMQRVDKPALLKRLFELGSEYSGQILSYNKMLGQLQDAGNTTTLARYLDLLSAAGLITGLPKFATADHRRKASSPKLNVLNTALMTALSGYTFEQSRADRSHWGRLVESAVGAHLFNTATPALRTSYWRESNCEVDFVLRLGRRLTAVEVKSGRRRPNASGLKAFSQRFKGASSILVGEGGVPVQEFLSVPAAEWFQYP